VLGANSAIRLRFGISAATSICSPRFGAAGKLLTNEGPLPRSQDIRDFFDVAGFFAGALSHASVVRKNSQGGLVVFL
jgi:hypothetical protein